MARTKRARRGATYLLPSGRKGTTSKVRFVREWRRAEIAVREILGGDMIRSAFAPGMVFTNGLSISGGILRRLIAHKETRRKPRPAGKVKVLAVGYYAHGCGSWPEYFRICKVKRRACGSDCRRVEVWEVPR